MSNLKKVLSVGLASTMVMGMVATSAAAATYDKFSDKDEIVNKDAVSMVSELGIIAGLPGGTYGPKQNIDRASFARLVCVALNGGQEPNLGNLKTTFTDTQGNWAEKYIAYCVQQGIIAGKGNNTFAPAANVTGSEAAKMLLVALGYNATYEGIGGATWQVTTDVLANQAGLYKGLGSMNTSEPLTRDNAAQMIYNTLNATKVKYEMVPGISANGQVTMTTQRVNVTRNAAGGKTVDVTMLEDAFNAIKVEGVVTANEFADLNSAASKTEGTALSEGKTEIVITNGSTGDKEQDAFDGTKTFSVATGADVLGKSVTLYVKDDSSSAAKATVLGTAIISEDNKVVTDTSGDSIKDVADDNNLDLDNTSNDGGAANPTNTILVKNYGKAAPLTASNETDKTTDVYAGVEKILIDNNDDGDVDYVILNTRELGKVTKYSTKDDGSITISAGQTFKADDKANVVGFDDVKKDDYVLTAWMGGKLHVEKAESVTGKLSAYKTGSSLTVDGTKYNVSKVPAYKDLTAAATYGSSTTLKATATFYLDQTGRVVAVGDAEETAYSFAYVWGAEKGSSIGNDEIKLTLEDGTTKTYVVDSDSPVYVTAGDQLTNGSTTDAATGKVVSYSIDKDGEVKIDFADAEHESSTKNASFEKGKTGVKIDGKTVGYANDNTAFFYVTMKGSKVDKVSVYTGYTNAPKVDSADSAVAVENNSGKLAAVAFVGTTTSAQAEEHLFLYKFDGVNDDDTANAYVFLNGKDTEEQIKVSDLEGVDVNDLGGSTANDHDDMLYAYTVDKDGNYELEAIPSGAELSGTVSNSPKTTLVVNNGKEYKLTDKTVVIDNVDNPGTPVATMNGAVNQGDEVMVVVDNDDDEVLMVVITKNGTIVNAGKDDIADAFADADTVNISGTVPADVEVPTGKTLVLTGDITGESLDNKGTVKLADAVVGGTLTVGGKVELSGTTTVEGTLDLSTATEVKGTGAVVEVAEGANVKYKALESEKLVDGTFALKLNGEGVDYIFNSDAALKDDLTVANSDTLVIGKGATLTVNTSKTLTIRKAATVSGTLNVVGTLTLEAGAEVNVGSDGDIAGAGTVTATSGAKIIVTKTLTAGNLSTINDAGTWTYNGSTWSKG